MYRKYHKIYSRRLKKDFEFEVFGHSGKPVMVFPCSEASFFHYKDSRMIEALADFIERGELRMFLVSTVDRESWFNSRKTAQMGIRHSEYEIFMTSEFIDFLVREYGIRERLMSHGVSWGAYHAMNFILKFPHIFDSAIALSGSYTLGKIVHGYSDALVRANDIVAYLPGLVDEKRLKELSDAYIVLCHGQGAWEEWNYEAQKVAEELRKKNIPHWYSVWDRKWPHDWPAWKIQLRFFLDHLKQGVLHIDGKIKLIGSERRIKPLEAYPVPNT